MEGVVILILVVLLILVIVFNSNTNNKLEHLQRELGDLRNALRKMAEAGSKLTPKITDAPKEHEARQPQTPLERWGPKEEPTAPQQEEAKPTSSSQVIPEIEIPEEKIPELIPDIVPQPVPSWQPAAQPPSPAAPNISAPPPRHKPGFFERNPDLEKFIGENLVSKIGIAILVIAIGFFVKFAIDNEWIGDIGRIAIGLLCGGILIGLAHRMHQSYKAFSSVLVGGGLAVLYFTIALAYKDYHRFDQTTAFIIMVVITAFAVILSLLYDRQEVAVIAMVGGFSVPFIVSNGSGNYITLFVYLLLLNTGLLIISYRKAWRLLNVLAFLFTVVIYSGWLSTLPRLSPSNIYRNGLVFATLFYLLFMAINIAHNVKQQKRFIASDFGIILINTALYFTAGMVLIHLANSQQYIGLFSGALGAVNLLLCFLLYRNLNVDKNVLYLLIGITLTFISLTIPLQLHGHFITLFWASEAVLLYWLHQRSKIALTKLTSLIIWLLMFVSLVMDWSDIYAREFANLPVVFNKGFITTIVAAIASYMLYVLRRKEQLQESGANTKYFPRLVFLTAAIGLLYLAGFLELRYQVSVRFGDAAMLYLLAYTFGFTLTIQLLSSNQRLEAVPEQSPIILLLLMVFIGLVTLPQVFEIQEGIFAVNRGGLHFAIHWLAALLMGTILARLIQILRKQNFVPEKAQGMLTWVACAVVVIFISCELHLLINQLFYRANQPLFVVHRVFTKAGLPIIWGLCSFVFMWLGMRHKYRPLRIVSLTLFLITLLKLFIFDIQNIPVAGKIAAFFCLGVLLLVVSFMYQRLKKIIADDKVEEG